MSEPSGRSYARAMLKLSGESLCAPGGEGIDVNAVKKTAELVLAGRELGVQMGVVIGGGNIVRGVSLSQLGINRATADYMGMLGTAINALALQDALEKKGAETRVCAGLDIRQVMEQFIRRRAIRHLEKGRVVILACGSGAPYFTTDTAASLRAVELGAEILLKATKVDGVYDKNPSEHSDARLFARLTYREVLDRNLRVMDLTAITMCQENNLPIAVFNMSDRTNLQRVLRGEVCGTIISN